MPEGGYLLPSAAKSDSVVDSVADDDADAVELSDLARELPNTSPLNKPHPLSAVSVDELDGILPDMLSRRGSHSVSDTRIVSRRPSMDMFKQGSFRLQPTMHSMPKKPREIVSSEYNSIVEGDLSLMALMARKLKKKCDADRVSVWLLDKHTGSLLSLISEKVNMLVLPSNKGLVGECITQGKVVNVLNAMAEHKFYREIDRRTGFHTHSMLCAPIWGRSRSVIGAVQLLNKPEEGGFLIKDEKEAKLAATLMAPALEAFSVLVLRTLIPLDPPLHPDQNIHHLNHLLARSQQLLTEYTGAARAMILVRDREVFSALIVDSGPSKLRGRYRDEEGYVRHVTVPFDGRSVVGITARSGTVENTERLQEREGFNADYDEYYHDGFLTRSCMLIPVKGPEGDILGIIDVRNKKGDAMFNDDDAEFMERLAERIGFNIDMQRACEDNISEVLQIMEADSNMAGNYRVANRSLLTELGREDTIARNAAVGTEAPMLWSVPSDKVAHLFLSIKSASGLIYANEKHSRSDPYVVACVNERILSSSTVYGTVNPGWWDEFTFENVMPWDHLLLVVRDDESCGSGVRTFLGQAKVPLGELSEEPVDITLQLERRVEDDEITTSIVVDRGTIDISACIVMEENPVVLDQPMIRRGSYFMEDRTVAADGGETHAIDVKRKLKETIESATQDIKDEDEISGDEKIVRMNEGGAFSRRPSVRRRGSAGNIEVPLMIIANHEKKTEEKTRRGSVRRRSSMRRSSKASMSDPDHMKAIALAAAAVPEASSENVNSVAPEPSAGEMYRKSSRLGGRRGTQEVLQDLEGLTALSMTKADDIDMYIQAAETSLGVYDELKTSALGRGNRQRRTSSAGRRRPSTAGSRRGVPVAHPSLVSPAVSRANAMNVLFGEDPFDSETHKAPAAPSPRPPSAMSRPPSTKSPRAMMSNQSLLDIHKSKRNQRIKEKGNRGLETLEVKLRVAQPAVSYVQRPVYHVASQQKKETRKDKSSKPTKLATTDSKLAKAVNSTYGCCCHHAQDLKEYVAMLTALNSELINRAEHEESKRLAIQESYQQLISQVAHRIGKDDKKEEKVKKFRV